MSRLDDAIANIAYIFDSLRVYRDIEQSGSCNNCKNGKSYACGYLPKPGQLVRYNCPFYDREPEGNDLDDRRGD